jgi:hypothetical protein
VEGFFVDPEELKKREYGVERQRGFIVLQQLCWLYYSERPEAF